MTRPALTNAQVALIAAAIQLTPGGWASTQPGKVMERAEILKGWLDRQDGSAQDKEVCGQYSLVYADNSQFGPCILQLGHTPNWHRDEEGHGWRGVG